MILAFLGLTAAALGSLIVMVITAFCANRISADARSVIEYACGGVMLVAVVLAAARKVGSRKDE